MTSQVLNMIARLRLVPVVEIDDASIAPALGRALVAGGLPCAEITFRTASAAEAIARMRDRCPDILVGAGTVLSVDQVDAAVDSGAAFVVSPGLNPRVVERALSRGVAAIPGVCTPSEVERAVSLGLSMLKFFPAEAVGGVAFLKAVAPVYRSVRFVPTGGIGPANVAGYLALPNVAACGGSWMVSKDLIAAGELGMIERRVREAVALVHNFTDASIEPGLAEERRS